MCEWILYKSLFQPDIICYNLLIDAYGHKKLYKKAETTYLGLLEARCIPTEDTYALLLRAYCTCGLLDKAEAIFTEMRNYGLPPSRFLFILFYIHLYFGINTTIMILIFMQVQLYIMRILMG